MFSRTPKVHLKPAAECNHPCHRCPHNSLALCPIDNRQLACPTCTASDIEINTLIKTYNGNRCLNC